MILLGCEVCLGLTEIVAALTGLPVVFGWLGWRFRRVFWRKRRCECDHCES